MEPFSLRTPRLVLDRLRSSDIDATAEYCADPLFERYMSTPWPYERHHAEEFIGEFAPKGWSDDSEWTWAIRREPDGPLLGVIGMRLHSGMIGYWIGEPHRGQGFMSEAATAAVDAVFERGGLERVLWECVSGNAASARVAKRVGFSYTGERLGTIPDRDGALRVSWTGELSRADPRGIKSGWPL